jgi:hypothetical protein
MKPVLFFLFFVLSLHAIHAQELVPFRENSLWGYKDQQGTVRIQPQYGYATKFSGNYAVVSKNHLLGTINTSNEVVIPFQHEYLRPLDSIEFLFGKRAVHFGEYKLGVMSRQGVVKIPSLYSGILKQQGLYIVTRQEDSLVSKQPGGDVRSTKQWYGLIDSSGKTLLSVKFESIQWINDSLLVVSKKNGASGSALFNRKGKQLTSFDYMVFGAFREGLAKARIGNRYGFVRPDGVVAIPVRFDYCEDFNEGFAMIRMNERWGAIDTGGKVKIQPKYNYQEAKELLVPIKAAAQQ